MSALARTYAHFYFKMMNSNESEKNEKQFIPEIVK